MFDHFILTRFNSVINHPIFNKQWNDDRTKHRLALFESITCPSIASQTNKNFKWLVLCNPKSPTNLLYKIEKLSKFFNFEIIFNSFYKECNSRINKPFLITTRIDADDAISKNHIDILQNLFNNQEFEFINFETGLRKMWGSFTSAKIKIKQNAFQSLIEKVSNEPKTVMCVQHNLTHTKGNVYNIEQEIPMWLQTIHGDNVANSLGSSTYWDNPEIQYFITNDNNIQDFTYKLEK